MLELLIITGAEVVRNMAGTFFGVPGDRLLLVEAGCEGIGKDDDRGCTLCLMTSRASLVS